MEPGGACGQRGTPSCPQIHGGCFGTLRRLEGWVLALKSGLFNGNDVHTFLEKHATFVAAAWNGRGPCYVDLRDIDPSARGFHGEHPVTIVHERLSFDQVEVIPVVGIERDVAYKLAVRRVVAQGAEGIAVRLGSEDIQLPSTLAERVTRLIAEIGASDLPLHVFMDFSGSSSFRVELDCENPS